MITEIAVAETKDGRPYIRAAFLDKEGKRYPGIMFDSNKLVFEPKNGDVVYLQYMEQEYNGQKQLKVSNMSKSLDADPAEYLPKTDLDIDRMFTEVKIILTENITTPHLAKLVNLFLSDEEMVEKFKKYPAAKTVHHAYIGGLLEHTLSVLNLALKMIDHYGNRLNGELLLLGALFHDIGKTKELESTLGFEYTSSGRFTGHLIQGMELINNYISKINDFKELDKDMILHMVASHHGFLEFGSPQKPKTLEAAILHHIDDMDAKVNTFLTIFERENLEEGWSNYDRLLERQVFKHGQDI